MPHQTSFDDALRLHRQGRIEEAERAYLQILAAQPGHPGGLHLLGVIRQQQGRHEEALELIGRAIEVNPAKAVYRNNYGAALLSLKRLSEAAESFQRALAICPHYPDALANLGMVQTMREEEAAAETSLRQALQIQPWHRDATIRMAALLEKRGQDAEALRLLQAALAAAPCAEFHAALGNLLFKAGLPEQAAEQYRAAIERKPTDAIAHFNLGSACEDLRDTANARKSFAQATELRPEKRLWRLRAEICGPAVFESQEEIEDYCARVGRVVEGWTAKGLAPAGKKNDAPSPPAPLPEGEGSIASSPSASLPEGKGRNAPGSPDGTRSVPAALADILEAGAFPGLALSYHGRDQRRLKEQFSALYEPCFSDQPPPAGSGLRDRKRIGILVTRRHEGMFLLSMRGIIERMSDQRWEVVILAPQSIIESLRGKFRCEKLRFASFGDSLHEAIRQIRAVACDLIYYWEVGSDAMNYFLPFARLAPVQCTGWGSTITSGVPAVDYFLSSELVERPGSQSQYTERLWKSRTLFRYQQRLPATPPATAADFGLPENRNLYVCFQNPLKLHLDFDPLLAGVLEADPRALVVLLADRSGQVARLLKERFARRIPQSRLPSPPSPLPAGGGSNAPSPPAPLPAGEGNAERIVFLPPQPFGEYCRLIQLADVILDPPHYGAGSSCHDLFSFNLPVVTWPGELVVGRVTQACYRKMDVEDLIVHSAEEYVRKAVQVATDRDYRQYVTARIANNSDALFNDLEAVREHERFFEDALAMCRVRP
jgi:predicted O-linked N-acetylglucosamine transferase (SPINDLY family)